MRVAGPLGLLLALGACQNLYIASDTNAGIQASLNTARTAGKLSVGWERDFVVLIPRSVDVVKATGQMEDDEEAKPAASQSGVGDEAGDEAGGEFEAMSVASCTDFDTDGIYITRFEQKLATGYAAHKLMKTMSDGEGALFRMGCFVSNSDAETK